jgi:hypothetical protein
MPGGFAHDYRADINQLKSTLQDRYEYDDGFSVVKEIIQNTEDAGAEHLIMGWTAGLSDATHPLLSGPAIFFINDRNLSATDAEAVRAFNLSAKADKSSSIGRFGLGLKSVFHLGEMFFYLSPSDIDFDDPEAPATACLNPWHSERRDAPHPDWSAFTEADQEAIRAHLGELLTYPEWFCLYVPLRQPGVTNPIVARYFESGSGPLSSFTAPSLPTEIGLMLPVLRRIKSIEAWHVLPGAVSPTRVFSVRLAAGAGRSQLGRDSQEDGQREFSGAVELVTGTRTACLNYGGLESLSWSDELMGLHNSPLWPKSEVYDSETARPVSCVPHAATYLALLGGDDPPNLQMQRSVFLPLDEPTLQPMPDSGFSVRIVRHGCQFVDAGRQSIKGLGEAVDLECIRTEDDVRRAWNRVVDDALLHPLMPLALDTFVRKCALDDRQIEAITAAVRGSSSFKQHRDSICAHHQWARVMGPSGSQWQLLDSVTRLLIIPRPPASLSLQELFPTLFPLKDRLALASKDDPALTASGSTPRLSPEHLYSLLDGMEIADEPVADHVLYLAELIDFSVPGSNAELGRRLLRILRQWVKAFAGHALGASALEEPLRKLVSCLPSGQRIDLGGSRLDANWLSGLTLIAQDLLIVPTDLTPQDDAGTGILSEGDSQRLLQYVSERVEAAPSQERRALSALVTAILSACPDAHQALTQCADGHLIDATILRGDRRYEEWLTLGQAQEALDEGRLFVTETHASLRPLSQAVESIAFVGIPRDLARLIGWHGEQGRVHASAVAVLNQFPPLAAPENRKNLLHQMLDELRSGVTEGVLTAVRYLLHGRPTAQVPEPLPLLCRSADVGVWSVIANRAVEEGRAAVVEASLANEVPPSLWEHLNLWNAGKHGAAQLLTLVRPDTVCGDYLTLEQVRQLLSEVEDVPLLREMRIHRDLKGEWVAIRPGSYWRGGFSPQADLPPGITLLEPDEDSVARARQGQLATKLSPQAAIDEALSQGEPGRYWRLIAEAWGLSQDTDPQRRSELRNTPWLPTEDGQFAAPCMVLAHAQVSAQHFAEAAALDPAYVSEHALHPDLRLGHLRAVVAPLLLSATESLRKLAELLARKPEHRLGALPLEGQEDGGTTLAGALRQAFHDGPQGLETVCQVLALADERQVLRVLQAFCQEIPPDRLLELLCKVQSRCEEGSTRQDLAPLLKPLMIQYLRAALAADLTSSLCRINLPNRLGDWRPAMELCVGGEGIARVHCVHRDLAPLFEHHSTQVAVLPPAPNGAASQRPAEVLRRYFRGWDAHVERPLIGALLGILGNDEDLLTLAEGYLEYRSLRWLRSSLDIGLENHTVEDVMARQRVEVSVQHGEVVQLRSLAGTLFAGAWEGHQEHIFAMTDSGSLFGIRSEHGKRVATLRLQTIAPETLNSELAAKLLSKSFERLLEGLYRGHRISAAPELWDSLGRSSQLGIRVVQKRILDALPISRGQLGLGRDKELGRLLGELDAVDRQVLEAQYEQRSAAKSGQTAKVKWLNDLLDRQKVFRAKLREALDADAGVHQELLAAVRQRVKSYQYEPDSVPFELFQNADDAVVELERLGATDDGASSNHWFVIQVGKSSLRFIHCGRKINQFAYGEGAGLRELGFDADLEKMLTLSGSDKNHAGDGARVTGKFGLGFKSVFQVTHRPRILSGALAVEVRGGLWPHLLSEERRSKLRERLSALGEEWRNGTVIELPLSGGHAQEVLERFEHLLHVQLVFSRRIKHCRIERNGEWRSAGWTSTAIAGIEGAHTAELQHANGSAERGLLLSPPGAKGAVLLGLSRRGIVPLGGDVPAVWATTPMREPVGLGVALNGEFQVDIGRSQVAAGVENTRIALAISTGLGDMLCRLSEAVAQPGGWDNCRDQLGIAEDVEPAEFWQTLWSICTTPVAGEARNTEHVGVQLLRSALWGQPGGSPTGLGMLYHATPTVPSGLTGRHACLLCLRDLRWFMTKSLTDEEVLGRLSEWELMQEVVPEGKVISETHFRRLAELLPGVLEGVQGLSLSHILELELRAVSFAVEPSLATRLGSVFSRKRVEELPPDERDNARDLLSRVTFRASASDSTKSDGLLVGHDDDGADDRDLTDRIDERARAGFAPSQAVLSQEYVGDALRFFLACRPAMRADAATLAKWVVAARDPSSRLAALRYLVTGQLNREVADHLRANADGQWFDPLGADARDLLRQMGVGDAQTLQGLLQRIPPSADTGHQPVTHMPRTASVQDIARWWQAKKGARRADYLDDVWGGNPPVLSLDDSMLDHSARREWMKLFLMGMFHSLGRTRAYQHRGFLERLDGHGWLDTLAERKSSPGTWEQLLDDYIDSDEADAPFYYWMRQFVGMRWLSRYLDDYVEGVIAINQRAAPHPDLILRQRSSSANQGTGMSCAPPLDKVLGIGQHFVFRELARTGLITNPEFYQYCFLPTAAVRQLASQLGCDPMPIDTWRDSSQELYEFLQDELGGGDAAVFGRDFDIPFQCLCRWPELRRDLSLSVPDELPDENGWED